MSPQQLVFLLFGIFMLNHSAHGITQSITVFNTTNCSGVNQTFTDESTNVPAVWRQGKSVKILGIWKVETQKGVNSNKTTSLYIVRRNESASCAPNNSTGNYTRFERVGPSNTAISSLYGSSEPGLMGDVGQMPENFTFNDNSFITGASFAIFGESKWALYTKKDHKGDPSCICPQGDRDGYQYYNLKNPIKIASALKVDKNFKCKCATGSAPQLLSTLGFLLSLALGVIIKAH